MDWELAGAHSDERYPERPQEHNRTEAITGRVAMLSEMVAMPACINRHVRQARSLPAAYCLMPLLSNRARKSGTSGRSLPLRVRV